MPACAAAKQRAAVAAVAELAALRQQAETAAAQAQAGLDAQWRQLLANDPDTVISTLAEPQDGFPRQEPVDRIPAAAGCCGAEG